MKAKGVILSTNLTFLAGVSPATLWFQVGSQTSIKIVLSARINFHFAHVPSGMKVHVDEAFNWLNYIRRKRSPFRYGRYRRHFRCEVGGERWLEEKNFITVIFMRFLLLGSVWKSFSHWKAKSSFRKLLMRIRLWPIRRKSEKMRKWILNFVSIISLTRKLSG